MAHLIMEIRYLGPVFLHHMYPYERFMSTLNKYTKSRVHPEGSMVQGYSVEEVIDWCLDFIDPTNYRHIEGSSRGKVSRDGYTWGEDTQPRCGCILTSAFSCVATHNGSVPVN